MSHVTPSRFAIIGLSVFSFGVVAGSFFLGHADEAPTPPHGNGAAISAVVPPTPYNTGKPPVKIVPDMTSEQVATLESSVAAIGVVGIAGYMFRHKRS